MIEMRRPVVNSGADTSDEQGFGTTVESPDRDPIKGSRPSGAGDGRIGARAAGFGSSAISLEIAGLADMDAEAVRRRWRAITGRQAPTRLPRHVLVRMLAWRLQIDAVGGPDLATEKFMERLGRDIERREADRRGKSAADADDGHEGESIATAGSRRQSPDSLAIPGSGSIKPGTLLVREHDGVVHRVMATGEGYAWNGTTYASLSKVAQAITGVNWSGPRFFGLLSKRPAAGKADAAGSIHAARKSHMSKHEPTGGSAQ